jgi:hypothetical protein
MSIKGLIIYELFFSPVFSMQMCVKKTEVSMMFVRGDIKILDDALLLTNFDYTAPTL